MAATIEAAQRAGARPPWTRPVRLTALYHEHAERGAVFVESDGWLLPRSYGDPATEQAALQQSAGLLDISESGKIDLKATELAATLASAFPDLAEAPVSIGATVGAEAIRILGLTAEQALLLTAPGALEETLAQLTQAATARERAPVTALGPPAPAHR